MWDILRKSHREAVSYIPLIPRNPSNVRYIETITTSRKPVIPQFILSCISH